VNFGGGVDGVGVRRVGDGVDQAFGVLHVQLGTPVEVSDLSMEQNDRIVLSVVALNVMAPSLQASCDDKWNRISRL
jgi:hypothetical protein